MIKKRLVVMLFAAIVGIGGAEGKKLQVGLASFYGKRFHKKKTSSGERFHQDSMTAAHRTLPFGTVVKVTDLKSHKSILVRINDRGPFKRRRIIDLSTGAAKKLGMMQDGIVRVSLEVVKYISQDGKGTLSDHLENNKVVDTLRAHAQVWSIQVGAFRDQWNALRAKQTLEEKGIVETSTEVAMVGGSKLYRVFLGPYTSADTAAERLRNLVGLKVDGVLVAGER